MMAARNATSVQLGDRTAGHMHSPCNHAPAALCLRDHGMHVHHIVGLHTDSMQWLLLHITLNTMSKT